MKIVLKFVKVLEKDEMPLKIPSLVLSEKEIKPISSIKFFGVLTDEHLTWKKHIAVFESKISNFS